MNQQTSFFRRILALTVAVAAVLPTVGAQADEVNDARERREQAQQAEADALAQIDLLNVEDQVLADTITALQAVVDAQQANVDRAEQAYGSAVREVGFQLDLITQTEQAMAATKEAAKVHAVDSFVASATQDESWLITGDFNSSARREVLAGVGSGAQQDALDELRILLSQRDQHRLAAIQAQADADELAKLRNDELVILEQRRDAEQAARAELQQRIDKWEADAAALQKEADDLTELIRAEQIKRLGFNPGTPGAASVEGFIKPVNAKAGSPFGLRRHPIYRSTRMHTGLDLAAPSGTPIWAAKDGVVIHAGRRGGYGNAVVIQHDDNVSTLYAHMRSVAVRTGDSVAQGDIIGEVGSTGVSTGPHLHFELRINGEPRDPAAILP